MCKKREEFPKLGYYGVQTQFCTWQGGKCCNVMHTNSQEQCPKPCSKWTSQKKCKKYSTCIWNSGTCLEAKNNALRDYRKGSYNLIEYYLPKYNITKHGCWCAKLQPQQPSV